MKATEVLKEDHRKVKSLFKEFERAKKEGDEDTKSELADTIITELTVHARAEEEIFYPAVKKLGTDKARDIIAESTEEHRVVTRLIEELSAMTLHDETFDAKMTVLMENVEHHIEEEEEEMFGLAQKLDLDALGEQLIEFKNESKMPPPSERGPSSQKPLR